MLAQVADQGGVVVLLVGGQGGEEGVMEPGLIEEEPVGDVDCLPGGSRHPFDQFIVAKTPAARWGTPEDLMGPALFLASDASDFVNGHILYVDGGILAYIGKQP